MPPRHAYWTILVDDQPTAFRAHDPEELLPTLNRLRDKNPSAVMKWFERGQLFDSRDAARDAGLGRGERRWEGPRPERDGREERVDRDSGERSARSQDDRPRDKSWRPGGAHRDPRQKYQDAKKAKWNRFKQKIREGHDRRQQPSGEFRPETVSPPHGDPMRDQIRQRPPRQEWREDPGKPSRPPDDRSRDETRTRPPRQPWRDDRRGADRDRPEWKERDRGVDQKKSFGAKPGPRKPWGSKPPGAGTDRKPWGSKPPGAGTDRKPWGSKPPGAGTGRKPWGSKPAGAGTGRKPWGSKPAGAGTGRKPWGSKPAGAGTGRKPWAAKPSGAGGRKPWGSKPATGSKKPWGAKPAGGTGRKPWGAKPKRRRDDEE